MRTLGIAVTMKATPVLSFVLLDNQTATDSSAEVAVEVQFEVPLEDRALAEQLGEAAKTVRGRVRSLAPDAVGVRRADWSNRASNRDGPRKRLLVEGAVTSAAYGEVMDTILLTGKECGLAHGSDKATVDAEAASLVQGKYKEAAAVALARLCQKRTS